MITDDKISDEKLQNDINKESAKPSALSSGKIDKYEYLTGDEMLPSNQRQIIEQATFSYFSLGKAFEKQIAEQFGAFKSLELSIKKDWWYIDDILSQNLENDLICVKLKEIVKLNNIFFKNHVNCKSKRGQTLPIVFKRHT